MASLNIELRGFAREVAAHYGQPSPAFHAVRVRPCLRWALVPKPRARREVDPPAEVAEDRGLRETADRWLSAGLAGAGLVDGGKSDAFPPDPLRRHGYSGLPGAGALRIEDFCALSRAERAKFGIWTVTVPKEAGDELERMTDGWAQFQDVLRRRFGEAHRRACAREQWRHGVPCPSHWCFVVEVQDNGRPHLHVVFRSKARSGRSWLLSRNRLDNIIRNALHAVTGRRFRCKAAGNVQTLRKDPGCYLSSYLKKGRKRPGAEAIMAAGYSQNMVPKQWWGCSAEARAWIREHTFPIPGRWVGWLSLHWPELAAGGMIAAALVELPGEGAPTVVCGRFRGVSGLRRVFEEVGLCSALALA